LSGFTCLQLLINSETMSYVTCDRECRLVKVWRHVKLTCEPCIVFKWHAGYRVKSRGGSLGLPSALSSNTPLSKTAYFLSSCLRPVMYCEVFCFVLRLFRFYSDNSKTSISQFIKSRRRTKMVTNTVTVVHDEYDI